ncbi:ECF RNA polymerase sigma factor SigK [Kitasatospora sp. NBC_00240]|uniref:ECF RNA polymerase sigma factor SigK n=1 Tax=Kitasatospora sp. NBC_00240 TaxID=2903567 RepID=UPI0022568CCE|nr:ECF RNA polymerase sigma factor SigK [Kitasatospora sp. NBC_00240]MCX5215087.1 ECF RNA polymerase sigma factor SigK [Kitasatospora sp. NBC_00240]
MNAPAQYRPARELPHPGPAAPGRPDRGAALRALVALVARGDETAFDRLYDRLTGPVLGVVGRVLRDRAQSEEVAQEVMLELWRSAGSYRPERGTVLSWALTIAHRRAVDRVRSAQAAHDRDQLDAVRSYVPVFDEVAEQVELRLEQERVRRLLGSLTEGQRESLTLAYYGGCTQAQIAAILGTPLGTVKTRIRDGLIRLRDQLAVEP